MELAFSWIFLFICFLFFWMGLELWKNEKGILMRGLAIFAWGNIPCLVVLFVQSVFK